MHRDVLAWSRTAKRLVVIALDVVLALLATWIAFTLRLDALHQPVDAQWWVYGLAPMLAVPVFTRFGLYRAIFRYTGRSDRDGTSRCGVCSLVISSLVVAPVAHGASQSGRIATTDLSAPGGG